MYRCARRSEARGRDDHTLTSAKRGHKTRSTASAPRAQAVLAAMHIRTWAEKYTEYSRRSIYNGAIYGTAVTRPHQKTGLAQHKILHSQKKHENSKIK